VNREELLVALNKRFQTFRKTPWFRVTYLVLLGIIVAQLYIYTSSPLACLVVLLIPVSVFVVPYWLGERKMRRFALNALVVFLIAVLLASAMSTSALLSQRDAVPQRSHDPASPMALTNGTVRPYHGLPSTPFTFQVELITKKNGLPSAYEVYLNLTAVHGISPSPSSHRMSPSPGNSTTNTRNGTWYQTSLSSLEDAVYIYEFSVWDKNRNWTHSNVDLGPLTTSGWVYFGFFLYLWGWLYQITLVVVVGYFAILFLWWYMLRARQLKAKGAAGPARKEGPKEGSKETWPATDPGGGGRASKAAAFTCTNCGADVSETDTKCPKCGAVFEE
jgi:hypothetical protein